MPSYKTVDSKTMLAAAESGQQGIRAAADRDQRAREVSQASNQRNAETTAQLVGQHEERKSRENLEQQQLAENVRRNRMGEAMQQDQQEMEMADKGLEKTGPTRADTLREEMARGSQQTGGGDGQQAQMSPEDQAAEQRGQIQGEKPLEVADPGRKTYAPTEEMVAQEGSKLTTNRLNAQANYMNATRNFAEAKMKGSTEAMEKEAKSLQQPIKEAARMFDLGKKGDLQPNQWSDIEALAKDAPDPALQQELQTKQFGPALSRFMQNRVAQSSIQFMAVTGDLPDGDLVDFASPAMREFTENAGQMQAYLRAADSNGLLSGVLGIQSMGDRNKLVRKLTAQAMLNNKAQPKQGGGALIPSQGGQSARNAARPDLDPAGATQRGLVQREQSTVNQQQQRDAAGGRGTAASGPESRQSRYARERQGG